VYVHRYTPEKLVIAQGAKYIETGPTQILPVLAGEDLTFQWIGMVEYIPCYSAPAVHWILRPVTRLASRKILTEQNTKGGQGQHSTCLASWVIAKLTTQSMYIRNCTFCSRAFH
jgi:hypothetical protein